MTHRTISLHIELTALLTAAFIFAPAASFLVGHEIGIPATLLLISGYLCAYVVLSDCFVGRLRDMPLTSVRLAFAFSAFAGAISTAVLYPLSGSDLTVVQGTAAIVLAVLLRLPHQRKN
jgi:hypothetical protein